MGGRARPEEIEQKEEVAGPVAAVCGRLVLIVDALRRKCLIVLVLSGYLFSRRSRIVVLLLAAVVCVDDRVVDVLDHVSLHLAKSAARLVFWGEAARGGKFLTREYCPVSGRTSTRLSEDPRAVL